MRPLVLCLLVLMLATGCGSGVVGLEGRPDSTVDNDDATDTEEPIIELCGNGIVDEGEECDDGDSDDCNGCSADCRWERAMQISAEGPGASIGGYEEPCPSCPFTLEVWFRLDEPSGRLSLFHVDDGFNIVVDDGLYEYCHPTSDLNLEGRNTWPGGDLAPGSWHHFAVTCWSSGDEWHFAHFLDGHGIYEGTCDPFRVWYCDVPLMLGRPVYFGDGGAIDDVRLSNQALYTLPSEPFTPDRRLEIRPDTLALWSFDSEIAGVAPDACGGSSGAVLVSGTLVPDDCHRP